MRLMTRWLLLTLTTAVFVVLAWSYWSLDRPRRGLLHAVEAMNAGKVDEAITHLDEVIRLDPDNALAYNTRGTLWYVKGDYRRAIADFSETIRLTPTQTDAYKSRGDAHVRLDELEQALEDYSEAVSWQPDYAEAWWARGSVRDRRKDHDGALADYGEAIRRTADASGRAPIYLDRAKAWQSKKDYIRAAEDLAEVVRLQPQSPAGHEALARLLATCPDDKVRDGKKAVVHAARACELTQWEYATHLDTLAAAYAEAGDFKEAVQAQRKALAALLSFAKADQEKAWQRLRLYMEHKPCREE